MKDLHNKVVRILSQNIVVDWLEPYKNSKDNTSVGSGFFIDNKGTILTCSHLIINSKVVYIEVPSEGKKKYQAEILMVCPDFDISILRVKNYKNKGHFKLIDTEAFYKIESGVDVHAVGFPLGQDNLKITQGVISGRDSGLIQTSAGLNKGNSGGPMLMGDIVIGINVSKIRDANNIGYATPIPYYYNIKHEKDTLVRRPSLGIHYINLNKHYIDYHNMRCKSGILIKKVFKNSPLWNAGIRVGNVLCSINNHNIDNFGLIDRSWFNERMTINDIKNTFKINDKIEFTYFNGKTIKKTTFKFTKFNLVITKKYPLFDESGTTYSVFGGLVVCETNYEHIKTLLDEECFNKFSLNYHTSRLATMYSNREESKLIITHLFPNTLIKTLENIKVGDTIKSINNRKVKTIEDYNNAMTMPLIKNKTRYFKLETEDNKIIVLKINDLLKEEINNSKLHKYQISDIYKKLNRLDKTNKKTKKNKKPSKKNKKPIKTHKRKIPHNLKHLKKKRSVVKHFNYENFSK